MKALATAKPLLDRKLPAYNSTYKKVALQCPPVSNGSFRAGLNDPESYQDRRLLTCKLS